MTWSTTLASCVFVLFVAAVHSKCPPSAAIFPCHCIEHGEKEDISYIHCFNLYSEQDLESVLQGSKGYDVFGFEIAYSSLRYLPHAAFNETNINVLEIRNTSLSALTDTDYAFEGLERSLGVLEIDTCTFLNDWDWSHLKKLERLMEITVIHSDLLTIAENLQQIAHLPIEHLQFSKNSISWLADDVFSQFVQAQAIYMDQNLIKEVKRSMFPNPAPALTRLGLSYNQIQTLPKDIFVSMPALESLYLTGNKMFTLDEETFRPVWGQLNLFFFFDVPLKCDCRITWTTKVKGPKFIHSKCNDPPHLKDKDLTSLTAKDLWC